MLQISKCYSIFPHGCDSSSMAIAKPDVVLLIAVAMVTGVLLYALIQEIQKAERQRKNG